MSSHVQSQSSNCTTTIIHWVLSAQGVDERMINVYYYYNKYCSLGLVIGIESCPKSVIKLYNKYHSLGLVRRIESCPKSVIELYTKYHSLGLAISRVSRATTSP